VVEAAQLLASAEVAALMAQQPSAGQSRFEGGCITHLHCVEAEAASIWD